MSSTNQYLCILHRLSPKASLQRFFITAFTGLMAIACSPEPTPPTSSDPTPETSSNPKIVTTFLPVHLFTKAVVGETGQVDILISPGAEVHDYQATPDDAKLLAQADVLVKNGLGMEGFLSNLVANAGNSKLQQIDASEGIKVIKEEHEEGEHEEGEHGHDEHKHEEEKHGHHYHGGKDPHVWLDPVLAQQQVGNIRDKLIEKYPNNADSYRSNAEAYIQQLQQLDNEFKEKLAPVQGCNFITFHDAFGHLAQRYGLQQEATDLILLLLLLTVTIAWIMISLPEQILLTLNSDLALVKGIPVRSHRYFFIVLLAITITLTIRAVGILLVNAFLVIPAATARLICQQFVPFLATAAGMGALSGVMGMVISGAIDLPSGPSIVLVQLFAFLIVALWCRQG